jgi:hypothetical protein
VAEGYRDPTHTPHTPHPHPYPPQALAAALTPVLEAELRNVTIPDQKFNVVVVDLHLDSMHITDASVALAARPDAGGVAVDAALPELVLSAQYHAWVLGIAAGSGTCTVKFGGSGGARINVTATPSGKPAVASSGVTVSVSNLNLDCSGGAGKVIDALEKVFSGAIKDQITSAAKSALASFIDTDANAALSKVDLDVAVDGGAVVLRFDLTAAPAEGGGEYLAVPVLGDAIPAGSPSRAPFPVPPVPPSDAARLADFVQVVLSAFTFESAAWAFWEAGKLATVVPHTVIPPGFPIQLNTTDVAVLAPGLAAAFPGDWLQLSVAVSAPPTFNLSATTGATLAAPVAVVFQPLTPTGPADAFALGCTVGAGLSLAVVPTPGGGQNLTGNLTYVSCDVAVLNSTVGSVSAGGLAVLVDFALADVVLPLFNAVLNAGVPIPSLDGLALAGSAVDYGAGFVAVSSNFTFTPPAAAARGGA